MLEVHLLPVGGVLGAGLDRFCPAARAAISELAEQANVREAELARLYLTKESPARAVALSLGEVMDLDSLLDVVLEAATLEQYNCEFQAGDSFSVSATWDHVVAVRVGADVDISRVVKNLSKRADLTVRVQEADLDDDVDVLTPPVADPHFWSQVRARASTPLFLLERFAEGDGGFRLRLVDVDQLEVVRHQVRRRSLIAIAERGSAIALPSQSVAEDAFFMISGDLSIGLLNAERLPFGLDPAGQAVAVGTVALPESAWILCGVVPDDDGVVRGRWSSIT